MYFHFEAYVHYRSSELQVELSTSIFYKNKNKTSLELRLMDVVGSIYSIPLAIPCNDRNILSLMNILIFSIVMLNGKASNILLLHDCI